MHPIGADNNHSFQLLCTKFYLITITRSKGKFFVNILLQGVLVNIYQVSFNFELKRVSPALGLKQLASKNLRESRTF